VGLCHASSGKSQASHTVGPTSVRVGFMVDRLAVGLVYFGVRLISSDSNIPSMLHTYSSNTDAI